MEKLYLNVIGNNKEPRRITTCFSENLRYNVIKGDVILGIHELPDELSEFIRDSEKEHVSALLGFFALLIKEHRCQ